MDGLTITAIVLMVLLVAGWIFYNIYTGKIIKGLIAENVALQRENEKLKKINKKLTSNNEIAGTAFKAMSFTATTKPVTLEKREELAKLLGEEKPEIIAVFDPVFNIEEENDNEQEEI